MLQLCEISPHLTLTYHHPAHMAEAGFMPQQSNFIHILTTKKSTALKRHAT